MISFDADARGLAGGSAAGFLDRPRLDRARVILPPDLLEGIERQVLGIARHLNLALDELLGTRHDLPWVLLGSGPCAARTQSSGRCPLTCAQPLISRG